MGKFLKKHIKKIILLLIVLVLVVVVFVRRDAKGKELPMVETTTVQYGDLVNSVSVNGIVESEKTKKIYTKLTYPVDVNHVEVGDTIKEGDILCELDVSNLENSIAEQRASANSTAAINSNTISLAEKRYEQAIDDLEDDVNGTISQAEQAVTSAEQRLESAEVTLDGAIDALQKAREDDRFSGVDGKSSLTIQAVNSRDQAYASYEAAKQNLTDAKNNLELAKHGVELEIDSLKDSITSSKVASGQTNAQWVGIENLEKNLEDAVVTSPVSGVVTAVYVTEGATPTGLMYVIEDINDLKVTANLKEYDLTSVTEGDMVEIKSDATGEEVYSGKVEKIAPTTTKTPTGENVEASGGGEFETEVGVDSKLTDLRIGTKARLEIIYEKKEDTIYIPYEAVTTDAEGNQIVLVPDHVSANTYTLRAVKIEGGMETDFMLEIVSSELKPGDVVISGAQNYEDGMSVHLAPGFDAGGTPAGEAAEGETTGFIVEGTTTEDTTESKEEVAASSEEASKDDEKTADDESEENQNGTEE